MDTVTDANGKFNFSNLLVTSEINFSLQGRNAKGKDLVELKVDKIRDEKMTANPNVPDLATDVRHIMLATFENGRKQDQELQKTGQLGRTQQLQEVVIRASKRKRVFNGMNILDGHADQTIRNDETDLYLNVLDWFKFKLNGIVFKEVTNAECVQVVMPFFRNEMMVLYVNGRKLTPCEAQDFWHIDPLDVDRVDVVRSNLALMSMAGGAAISVMTKRNIGIMRSEYNPAMVSYNPRGYDPVKEFYAPKYNNDGNDARALDFRTTVYWNPGIVVGESGQLRLSYCNGDAKGKYRVVV